MEEEDFISRKFDLLLLELERYKIKGIVYLCEIFFDRNLLTIFSNFKDFYPLYAFIFYFYHFV